VRDRTDHASSRMRTRNPIQRADTDPRRLRLGYVDLYIPCECCAMSGRGLGDGSIPLPVESYRVCVCVCVCVYFIECNQEQQ